MGEMQVLRLSLYFHLCLAVGLTVSQYRLSYRFGMNLKDELLRLNHVGYPEHTRLDY